MYNPSAISSEIRSLVHSWEPRLNALPQEIYTQRHNNQDRNIKQILGHLVDSASNNTHRIVHLQYQPSPLIFPNYATFGNNDRWIAIQNYYGEDWNTLIGIWKYSMLHLCHVIEHVNLEKLKNQWTAGPDEVITLEEMIIDFPVHMKLHLDEIEELIQGPDGK